MSTQFNLGTITFTLKNTTGLAPGFMEEIVGMLAPYFTGTEGRGALVEIELDYLGYDERADIVARGELGSITGHIEPELPSCKYVFTLDRVQQ